MTLTPLPLSPFITDLDHRFVPDFDRLETELRDELSKLNTPPKFLSDPSPAYLTATELLPICEVLSKHR